MWDYDKIEKDQRKEAERRRQKTTGRGKGKRGTEKKKKQVKKAPRKPKPAKLPVQLPPPSKFTKKVKLKDVREKQPFMFDTAGSKIHVRGVGTTRISYRSAHGGKWSKTRRVNQEVFVIP